MMHDNSGAVHSASFETTGLTAGTPYDLLTVIASSNSRIKIHEVNLSAVSSADTSIGISLLRGSTQTASTSSITPVNLKGWSEASTASASVRGPSSGLSSTASAVPIYQGSLVDNGFQYRPEEICKPVLDVSQRLHIRSDDAFSQMRGTVVFEEIGKIPG